MKEIKETKDVNVVNIDNTTPNETKNVIENIEKNNEHNGDGDLSTIDKINEVNDIDNIENKIDEKKVKEAEKELSDYIKKIESKKYLVHIGKKEIENYLKFIRNDAQWGFTECMGIIEIDRKYSEFLTSKKEIKNIELTVTDLEASYYFISRFNSKGLSEAKKYHDDILIPVGKKIADAIVVAKQDKNEIRKYEDKVSAAKQGIEMSK